MIHKWAGPEAVNPDRPDDKVFPFGWSLYGMRVSALRIESG